MSNDVNPPQDLGLEVESRGLNLSITSETEAHMPFRRIGPSKDANPAEAETEAHMPYRRSGPANEEALSPAETDAHAFRRHGLAEDETAAAAETEAHMPFRRHGPAEEDIPAHAETEAHGILILTFAPEAPEQTIEVRYRPSKTPGEPPEVELHANRWSDRRLKRDVRSL